MTLIERYILKIAASAFVACLVALTAIIWITQALRELDLITGKGQTFLVFLTVTGLTVPTLIAVISPVALFVAVIYTLNRLNGDSELIVMSASGMSPRHLLRPFLALAACVSGLTVFLTLYIMPASFQELRDLITKIRADFVANIVKEGQFTALDSGVTFHFRERAASGALLGILVQDRREQGRVVVYLAERGQAVEANERSYLLLEKGSVHRQQANSRDQSIILFERYAVDLAAFAPPGGETVYKPRERTTAQLLSPDPNDYYVKHQQGRLRAELHDRFSSWLFPLAVMVIAFAALGGARTTRQGRGTAIAVAIVCVVTLRIAAFAASSAVVRSPWALAAVYGIPLGTMALALFAAFQTSRFEALNGRILALIDGIRLPALVRLKRA